MVSPTSVAKAHVVEVLIYVCVRVCVCVCVCVCVWEHVCLVQEISVYGIMQSMNHLHITQIYKNIPGRGKGVNTGSPPIRSRTVWRTGTILTVRLSTDEAGGCTVEEREKASHCQADVGVGGSQVQRGEPGELDLQNILGSHLHVRHLRAGRERTQTRQPRQRYRSDASSLRLNYWLAVRHSISKESASESVFSGSLH